MSILFFSSILQQNSAKMSHNVPVVCDGFAARIGKPQVCRAAKLWRSFGVGMGFAHNLAKTQPEPPFGRRAHTILLSDELSYPSLHCLHSNKFLSYFFFLFDFFPTMLYGSFAAPCRNCRRILRWRAASRGPITM